MCRNSVDLIPVKFQRRRRSADQIQKRWKVCTQNNQLEGLRVSRSNFSQIQFRYLLSEQDNESGVRSKGQR